jgi:hypothetical protein
MTDVEEVMMCSRATTLSPTASSYKFPHADGMLLILYVSDVFYLLCYTKRQAGSNAFAYKSIAMKQSKIFS